MRFFHPHMPTQQESENTKTKQIEENIRQIEEVQIPFYVEGRQKFEALAENDMAIKEVLFQMLGKINMLEQQVTTLQQGAEQIETTQSLPNEEFGPEQN